MFATKLIQKRLFSAANAKKWVNPSSGLSDNSHLIDFRSDTITRPCEKMRDAMANAVVGDDIYQDCPTTKKLEKDIAQLLGKEAALFVASGTQANLLSMMTLAQTKGDAVIMGNHSHMIHYERGGIAAVAGVLPYLVPNDSNGELPLDEINYACQKVVNEHITPVAAISLESPAQHFDGKCLRMDHISKVKKIAKKTKAKMHLDGARSWNAAMFLDMEMKDMVKDFDLVSICMSKGMGCPVGSLVVGTEKNIWEARNYRKMLGGAMRQTGVLAACGLVSLMDWEKKITQDNDNARWMAEELASIEGIRIDPEQVETNLVRFRFTPKLLKEMRVDYHGFVRRLKEEEMILANSGFGNDYVRFVTHRDVDRAKCEKAIQAVKRLTSS